MNAMGSSTRESSFLLFGGDDYYAGGGMADFRGRFDTVEAAEHAAKNAVFENDWSQPGTCEWWQIVSSETLEIVKTDREEWGQEINAHIAKHLRAMERPTTADAAPMQCVVSVLRELNTLGVWHAIDGCENWDSDTITHAVAYQRRTGRNPVIERGMIMDAENEASDYCSQGFEIATPDQRDVAEAILDGGCWKITENVRDTLELKLSEADRRESYAYRREEANLHIANRSVRTRIFNRDGNQCLHCGNGDRLSVDHIVAVANGGGDEDENLQTLCVSCNSSKGSSSEAKR